MPRGRPKRVIQEPPSDVEEVLAKKLYEHCDIPGCKLEWHVIDAREVLRDLETTGYKITRERLT